MLSVLRNSWALLIGIFLLMLGNGMQSTLLGIRGGLEGFSPATMSLVMTGYFVGFLGGSRMAPWMIKRVGHVRVFAALASFISAVLVLYPVMPDPLAWAMLRVVIGFSFSGVYVVAESWLNNSATNETRGQTLSVYLIVQMLGIISAQMMVNLSDPGGFVLFIIPSVLVSISFAPILLSIQPAPVSEATEAMSLSRLFHTSPLAVVGAFILGGIFAAQFGMAPVYGTQVGLSVSQISVFVAVIYVGGLLCQYPIGWASDRSDRRVLILGLSAVAGVVMLLGMSLGSNFTVLLVVAFVVGGISNPLYSLFIAYINDYLKPEDMASAASGLIFVNGLGAIAGPIAVGWAMQTMGPGGFFAYMGALFAAIVAYGLYRSTRRATHVEGEAATFAPIAPVGSPVAVEALQEYVAETALDTEAGADEEA